LFNAKGTYIVDLTKFSLVLIDRPHIANYVRTVRVIMRIGVSRLDYAPLLPVVSSVLANLDRIESITLDAGLYLPWGTLDPELRTSIQQSISLPSIKEVAIAGFSGFPLKTFDGCKNLRNLLLYGQFIGAEGVSSSPYPRLSSLRFNTRLDATRVISWMRSNTLHSLSLSMTANLPMDLSKCHSLIDACSATLVNLELKHEYCSEL
jgi:hypothetical protein